MMTMMSLVPSSSAGSLGEGSGAKAVGAGDGTAVGVVGASVGAGVGANVIVLHCLLVVVVGATDSHASAAHAVVVVHVLSVVNTEVAPKAVVVGTADSY